MKITKEVKETLKTTDGHSYKFNIDISREGIDRKNQMIKVLKKINCENIIHIGCCGHLNNIQRQLDNGTWFHDMLCDNFDNVIGTDINKEAIDFLINKGKKRVYARDAISDSVKLIEELERKKISGETAIILPEVLEHIDNPINFLKNLKERYPNNYIIITVPNAFGTWVMKGTVIHNYELINSDHKYWFTPYTLIKNMAEAGIDVTDLMFCDWSIITKLLKKPILSNTLLALGKM